MKNWFWIPLAAIAGVIAGSWGPREDLEKFKEGVREERTQKKVSGTAGFDAFARLANIPDVARRRPKARTNELARSVGYLAPVGGTTNAAVVTEAEDKKSVSEEPKRDRRISREDLKAALRRRRSSGTRVSSLRRRSGRTGWGSRTRNRPRRSIRRSRR